MSKKIGKVIAYLLIIWLGVAFPILGVLMLIGWFYNLKGKKVEKKILAIINENGMLDRLQLEGEMDGTSSERINDALKELEKNGKIKIIELGKHIGYQALNYKETIKTVEIELD